MSDFERLDFDIPAFTPETMPLDRLIEYLQQIALIIGDTNNLHLIEVAKGSTVPGFLVPKNIAGIARERAAMVERGDGTVVQMRAYDRVRRMIRRDSGGSERVARLRSTNRIILEIPPAPDDSGILVGIRQQSSIDGCLIRIGGSGDSAALQMQDMEGQVLSGFTASKTLAKEMAALIYEPMRVSGVALWNRSAEGVWEMDRMQVQSYELLDDEPATVLLDRLRGLDVKWPDDADQKLSDERGAMP